MLRLSVFAGGGDAKCTAAPLLSFVFQAFESVEAVPPTEPRADEEASQHSAPLKDDAGSGDAPQRLSRRQPSPDLSDRCSGAESSPLPAEAAVESAGATNDSTKPAEREEIMEQPESEISETGSENEKRCRSDTFHGREEGNPPGLSQSKAAETNSRSVPEKTNVLKLETEVRNEYFQAPPLGETLAFQAHKNKCDQTAELEENNLSPSSNVSIAESEQKDAEAAFSEPAECKKITEIPSEKPGSNSPVRQVLNALQSLSHSRQSPDTAESDDSPSALEMEDIPMGITCVTSEDTHSRPLVGLAPPPACFLLKEKMASEDLVLDRHLDTDCNTSPEATDLGLSEEEPEMENVLMEAESAETSGGVKRECSGEQVYSVSITPAAQTHLFSSLALTNTTVFAARDPGHVLDQFTSH